MVDVLPQCKSDEAFRLADLLFSFHSLAAFHADFVWSKYFSGYDLKMPSADAHAEEYFKHLKGLLN